MTQLRVTQATADSRFTWSHAWTLHRSIRKEAIEKRKHECAAGSLDDYELDQALDDALTSENPGSVVERYTENDHERERD